MLYGGIIVTDYFRNYIPVAVDIEVEVLPREPFEISIKEFLLQGAKDFDTFESPTPGVLDLVPVQRGWRTRPIIEELPRHGSVTWDGNKGSFFYTARVGYEGPDCFTYVLTNGFQKSLMAQITIQIGRTYTIDFVNIFRFFPTGNPQDVPTYLFTTSWLVPPGSATPLFLRYIWRYTDYKYLDESDGVPRIRSSVPIFYQTTWKQYGTYPTVEDQARNWQGQVATNEGLVGVVEDTEVPYRAPVKPFNVKLEVRMYFTHRTVTTRTGRYLNGKPTYYQRKIGLNYAVYESVYIDMIESDFGPVWYQSGNVRTE